jgi:acyl transferase domain-containing protein
MQELMESLQRQNLFCRLVNVDVASHSPQMDPLRTELLQALDGLQRQPATLPIYSTVTGALGNEASFDANYWMRNLREPVLFSTAIEQLLKCGHNIFIEISPHPILLGAIQQPRLHRRQEGVALPSLRREEPERAAMLGALGMLYTQGYPIAWNKLYPNGGECVSLPSYPWQRQRFWLDTRTTASSNLWNHADGVRMKTSALLGARIKLAHPHGAYVWQTQLDNRRLTYLADHRVEEEILFPAAAYVEMALQAAAQTGLANSHVLTDFVFTERLLLPADAPQLVQTLLVPDKDGAFSFSVYGQQQANWILHASAVLRRSSWPGPAGAERGSAATIEKCLEELDAEKFYQALWKRGIQYGSGFRGVARVWRKDGEALGRISLPEPLQYESAAYQIHPALLDACLQVLAATPAAAGDQNRYVPSGCRYIRFYSRPDHHLWSHVALGADATREDGVVEADIRLFDDANHVVAELLGFRLQRVTRRARRRNLPQEAWLYHIRWQAVGWPEHLPFPAPGSRRWIIFADREGLGRQLATSLAARGDSCLLVTYDEISKNSDQAHDDAIRQTIEKLLGNAPLYGIIHLWGLDAEPASTTTERSQVPGCDTVLSLVQTITKRAMGSPRLWLVTRGAQPVQDGEPLAVAQTPLWGLGKVISFELPELKCTRLDLDPAIKCWMLPISRQTTFR